MKLRRIACTIIAMRRTLIRSIVAYARDDSTAEQGRQLAQLDLLIAQLPLGLQVQGEQVKRVGMPVERYINRVGILAAAQNVGDAQ